MFTQEVDHSAAAETEMSISTRHDGETWKSSLPWWIATASLFVFYFIRSLGDLVHPDVGWFLWASGRVLDGAHLYRDIVDMNPPLIFYFMIPPVWCARITGLPEVMVFKSFILLTAFASLWICARFVRTLFQSSSVHIQHFVVFVIAFLFISIPGGNYGFLGPSFGQREHIMGMLFMPFVLASVSKVLGKPPGTVLTVIVAILAGVALAIKPYFLIGWLALEAALVIRSHRVATVVRLESLIVTIVILLYAISVLIFAPGYLDVVRKAALVYGAYDASWWDLVTHRHFVLWMVAMLIFVFSFGVKEHDLERRALFFSGTGFLVSVFAQRKGWGYHYYPSALFTGTYLGIMVAISMERLALGRLPRFLTLNRIVAFTTVALLGAASKPMFDSFSENQNGPIEDLINIAKTHADHQPLMALSTSNLPGFPVVNYSGALWSSRFVELWFLPGLYPQFLRSNHSRYRPRNEMGETERYFFDAVVEDFEKAKPRLLIDDVGTNRLGFGRTDFDFLSYYSQDSSFARLFSAYKPVANVGQYVVYVR